MSMVSVRQFLFNFSIKQAAAYTWSPLLIAESSSGLPETKTVLHEHEHPDLYLHDGKINMMCTHTSSMEVSKNGATRTGNILGGGCNFQQKHGNLMLSLQHE